MKLATQKTWGKNLYKDMDFGFYHYQRTHNGKRIVPKSLCIKDLKRAKEMRDLINNFVALHGEAPWQNNMDTEIREVFIERFGICPWKSLNPDVDERESFPKWYDVCKEWYSSKVATCEFSTLKTYRQILKRHLLNVPFKRLPINEIKKKDINRWWFRLNYKTDTINQILNYMSNVFDYAIELEYTDINPVKTIKRPKNKGVEIKPFETNEIPLLIDNVVDRYNLGYQDYLIVRITTGLRTEEINALEIGHVDLKYRILKVVQAVVLKEMKGTKTGKYRDVELNNEAYLAIKRQMKRAMQRTPKMFKGQERRFLWVNSKGNPLCASNFSYKVWKPIFEKLTKKYIKIEYRRPNQLRHTYISHCLAQGDNISWVANQTGHTVQTLLKVYARYIKDKNHGKIADDYFTRVLHGNESEQYEMDENTSS